MRVFGIVGREASEAYLIVDSSMVFLQVGKKCVAYGSSVSFCRREICFYDVFFRWQKISLSQLREIDSSENFVFYN